MKSKLIIHIPHSGIEIPIKDGFIIADSILENEILKLTDWYTDELFEFENSHKIIFPYSRVFCDPERFEDDSQEIMAKFGMGVLYEKTDDGSMMREITPQLRTFILNNYYHSHHDKLTSAVEEELNNNRAIILDCHSFPNKPFNRDLIKKNNRPDFNIGIDDYHTPKELIDLSVNYFNEHNYTLEINTPYSGTIVPMKYYKKEKKVMSIMLEVNRKLYLNNNTNVKSKNYDKCKKIVQGYINLLSKY